MGERCLVLSAVSIRIFISVVPHNCVGKQVHLGCLRDTRIALRLGSPALSLPGDPPEACRAASAVPTFLWHQFSGSWHLHQTTPGIRLIALHERLSDNQERFLELQSQRERVSVDSDSTHPDELDLVIVNIVDGASSTVRLGCVPVCERS